MWNCLFFRLVLVRLWLVWKKRWKSRRALEFPVVFSLFLDGTTLYEHNGSCVPLPGIPSGSQLSQNIISPARVCLVKIILDSSWRWLKIWHYANHLVSLFHTRSYYGFLQNPIFMNSLKKTSGLSAMTSV